MVCLLVCVSGRQTVLVERRYSRRRYHGETKAGLSGEHPAEALLDIVLTGVVYRE